MTRERVGFFLSGRLILELSLQGLFEGEIEDTIKLLAYERHISPDMIGVELLGVK